jgi:biotin carboxyl carrier protein
LPKVIRLMHGGHTYGLSLDVQDLQATLKVEKDGMALPPTHAVVRTLDLWLLIQMGGRTHRCLAVPDKDGVWVSVDGHTHYLRFKIAARQTDPGAVDAGTEIRAPMTGTVSKIEVKAGDAVSPGDLVAVMEAMKMEYRLEAPMLGTVARVLIKPGDLVDLGALLLELTPVPPA